MNPYENEFLYYLDPDAPLINEHFNKNIIEDQKKTEENNFYDETKFGELKTGFDTNNFVETGDEINELYKTNNENNVNNDYNNDNNENNYINEHYNNDNNENNYINEYYNNDNKIINNDNNNYNFIKKKKGRRKNCDDNMSLKLKNKFHDFIISYLNNQIKKNYGYQKRLFRKINYEIIKKQNYEDFFKQSLKSFLKFDISSKNKNHSKNQNGKTLKFLSKNINNKNIINLLDNSLAYFYKNYFLKKKVDENNEKLKIENNEEIVIEIKKNKEKNQIVYFDDFIEQLRKKNENEDYIEKLKKIANEDFIHYYNKIENQIFYIQKIKK